MKRVYMRPADVIEHAIKALSPSATPPTGYGTLGAPGNRLLQPS